ncbi:hypothetical protein E2C01_093140 [Portunus trituberculatus]|uniref:Uncharacterized protein n=1 Tax=Portunus trituberculatus TaxID=210409 RepID=A0A5B7JT83_PORTR|nr:hypothetical protein [Portunus trituberculatus]
MRLAADKAETHGDSAAASSSCDPISLLRDSRDFCPYSSSAEWADKDKTSSSALSEAHVEGPVVAGSAGVTGTAFLTGLKNK